MSKHKHRSTDSQTVQSGRYLVADERQRAPGHRHEIEHGLSMDKGQTLHVTTSFNGFGRLRWIRWDEAKLFYEIEGRPDGLSFSLTVIEAE